MTLRVVDHVSIISTNNTLQTTDSSQKQTMMIHNRNKVKSWNYNKKIKKDEVNVFPLYFITEPFRTRYTRILLSSIQQTLSLIKNIGNQLVTPL